MRAVNAEASCQTSLLLVIRAISMEYGPRFLTFRCWRCRRTSRRRAAARVCAPQLFRLNGPATGRFGLVPIIMVKCTHEFRRAVHVLDVNTYAQYEFKR